MPITFTLPITFTVAYHLYARMKIEEFHDPYLNRPWSELGARVLSSGNRISVTLGYPAQGFKLDLQQQLAIHLGVADIDLELRFAPPAGRGFSRSSILLLWLRGQRWGG